MTEAELTNRSKYEHNAIISSREILSDDLAIIRVSPIEGEIPDFTPGQYAELAIIPPEGLEGKLIRRSYSIASTPADRQHLEFYLVRVPGGVLTPELWRLNKGDSLWLGPKIKGKFTLQDVPAGKDLVLVSTGTGLAPFVSMLRYYHGTGRWRRVVIVHGARHSGELGYRELLEGYANKHDDVFYLPTLTREAENTAFNGSRGRVLELLKPDKFKDLTKFELTPEDSQVMLCGNPAMIDDAQAYLESIGFNVHSKKTPGNIHFERYW